MFRSLRSTVAVAVVLLAMPIAVAGPARSRGAEARQGEGIAPNPDDAAAVAKARLKVSRQALDLIRRWARHGVPVIDQRENFYRWSYRLLGDQIYLSMSDDDPRVSDPEVYLALSHARTNPQRVAAFEDHLQRMKEWESLMRPLYQRQMLSTLDFLDDQSHCLEAELWLARERAKEREE